MTFVPDYAFQGEPPLGEAWEAAPGVRWLRMPLPFKLNHINLWILEDGDGWTLVDTGINTQETRDAWERIFAGTLQGRPVKRVIVTHFHPDHVGLAGWLCERFQAPLWMPFAEWTMGRMLAGETTGASLATFRDFYIKAGFTGDLLEAVDKRIGGYGSKISPIPPSLIRLSDGDEIRIGRNAWRIIVGNGHSPEHACLFCPDLNVLISGDQVLPKISPNISVWPQEPEADPLRRFLTSLEAFKSLPADCLVLPSHNWPFRGLSERLDDLAAHHAERLDETLRACTSPVRATEVLQRLFTRELDIHQLFFAIGETLAHLRYLMAEGRVVRTMGADGVHLFVRA